MEMLVIKMKKRVLSLIAVMVIVLPIFAANIETDRTWYLAGEAIRVNVTADDASIVYAELCDTYSLVAGTIVRLKGNNGTGFIELPSDLHSGYYVLSVYTRHETKVSQRLIAVVNPFQKSEDDDIEWVEIKHPDSLSYALSQPELTSAKDVDERETEGHIIKARVKNIYDGHTFSSSQIHASLSIIGKQIHYFEGKMVNDSIAVFYTYGILGKQPLVLSACSSTGVSLPVEMMSPFTVLLPKELPHLVFYYKRNEVETRLIDLQRSKPSEKEVVSGYDDMAFGTKPDLSYNLDEYRPFLIIREVLLEYVSCVSKRTRNGVDELIVRKEQEYYNSYLPSLVLIDGMPVHNLDRLLNYDARRIHYINIYGGQYTFGNGIYHGILSFVSRSGQLTNYPIERNMQYLMYDFPN